MANFFEESIRNYSGLSTETKPTIAAGVAVPNGSRWREVDTGKVFFFNLSDDTWYESAPSFDASTHAQTTIDYAHHEIHSGSHYKCGYQDTTLDTDDTVALVFTTPDTTKWMHFVLTSQVTGPATIQLFETPTLSAEGTALTPVNRNRNSASVSTMVVKHTPTVTVNGTKLSEKWVGSDGFKEISGGSVRGDSEMILKQDTQYLVLLTAEADTMKAAIGGDWYEHTDRA